MNKKALIEVGKSFARFIWFGLLGLVATFLVDLVASGQLNDINVVIYGQTVNLSFVVLALVTGLVKLIDRYKHESTTDPSNGIAPRFLQR
jgi:choline-glycine betaine transporter